jgi:hypothetical protein
MFAGLAIMVQLKQQKLREETNKLLDEVGIY